MHIIRYTDFSGRSTRLQYWIFFFFNLCIQFLAGNLDYYLLTPMLGFQLAAILVILAMIVPGIAVSVRRLHDVGKNGWLLLVALIPIAGVVYLVYLFVQPSSGEEPALAPS